MIARTKACPWGRCPLSSRRSAPRCQSDRNFGCVLLCGTKGWSSGRRYGFHWSSKVQGSFFGCQLFHSEAVLSPWLIQSRRFRFLLIREACRRLLVGAYPMCKECESMMQVWCRLRTGQLLAHTHQRRWYLALFTYPALLIQKIFWEWLT